MILLMVIMIISVILIEVWLSIAQFYVLGLICGTVVVVLLHILVIVSKPK